MPAFERLSSYIRGISLYQDVIGSVDENSGETGLPAKYGGSL